MTDIIVPIIIAVFASTGFWSFLQARFQKKDEANDKLNMLIRLNVGIAHDRIHALCHEYISRGSVSDDEMDNLTDIYEPYRALGGNGSGKLLYEEVKKLPVRPA